jgi:hypothetical protein
MNNIFFELKLLDLFKAIISFILFLLGIIDMSEDETTTLFTHKTKLTRIYLMIKFIQNSHYKITLNY